MAELLIETTLAAGGRPVTVGVPGYVLPMDLDARLFLQYPKRVASLHVEPPGALAIERSAEAPDGWHAYAIHGKTWGRARLTVTYEDRSRQSVHYRVVKPAAQAVDDLGRFLTERQWFDDPDDPFGRGPSVMSYDREADRIDVATREVRLSLAPVTDFTRTSGSAAAGG